MKALSFVGKQLMGLAEALGSVGLIWQKSFSLLVRGKWSPSLSIEQMNRIGVQSFAVVSLTSFFTGMVLAFQSGLRIHL